MIVLGGGPVGCELSQAWSTLGTEVTLVEGGERLLSREEPFAGEEVAESLRESFGVDVRTGTKAERVARRRATASTVELERRRAAVEAAEILVAVGRVPRTAELGLDAVGVEPDEHGFLETDDRLRVGGRDWLYAIGDVNGRALFTHMGKYQAWVAAENAARPRGRGDRRRHRLAPRHLHRPPGRRGRQDPRRRRGRPGIDARAVDVPTDGTAGASFQGKETGGTSRLVVDQAARDDRRRHLHRLRDRRLPPRRDRRDRRRGAAPAAPPRGRRLPHAQRDLAEAAGGVRPGP